MDIDYNKLAMHDDGCIHQLRKNLNIDCNGKAGKVIRVVLHAIRSGLDYSQSAELIRMMPDYLKAIYVLDWRSNGSSIELKHLDNLVEEVVLRDERERYGLINGELTALTMIVITMKVLNCHVDMLSFEHFNYTFRKELAEAVELVEV
jgi:uncharacterized protein (DUF2267 family)